LRRRAGFINLHGSATFVLQLVTTLRGAEVRRANRHDCSTRAWPENERNVTEGTGLDRARQQVKNADWLNALARVGLVAIGVSYALVGILAMRIAVESGGKGTS